MLPIFALCLAWASALQPRARRGAASYASSSSGGDEGGLAPEKAAQLRALGYNFDAARRSWTRAPPSGAARAKSLRSGLRSLRILDALEPHEAEAAALCVDSEKPARARCMKLFPVLLLLKGP